jgi:hypothetical protein
VAIGMLDEFLSYLLNSRAFAVVRP